MSHITVIGEMNVRVIASGYRELPQGEAYFANVEGQDCGVPQTSMITKMFRG